LIGNFFRPGTLYTQEVIKTFDHDWPSAADGLVIPHGLYDLKRNEGFVTLGTSHDTSEFACDSLLWWWKTYGRHDYPEATSLLLLCDGGGSNRANTTYENDSHNFLHFSNFRLLLVDLRSNLLHWSGEPKYR
jgi:Rhodopirellula transposase DDE domain